jgi:hypothetical protein
MISSSYVTNEGCRHTGCKLPNYSQRKLGGEKHDPNSGFGTMGLMAVFSLNSQRVVKIVDIAFKM